MINDIATGHYLIRGFKLLWHPKLRVYTLLPILINIILLIAIFAVAWHYFGDLVTWLVGLLPHWLAWLSWLLWALFGISILVIFAYIFTILTNVVGAPFNAILAEKVQELYGKRPASADMNTGQTMTDIPRSIGRAGRSFLYFIPRAIICLLLFFIPLVQTIAPFCWFLLSAWMMSVQYCDYPYDNNRQSFQQMLKALGQKRWAHLSFGCVTLIATMIPVINLFVMPAAVIGATLLWVEQT